MTPRARHQRGLTLVELLITVTLTAVLLTALTTTLYGALAGESAATARLERLNDVEFAMSRMSRALAASQRLILPRPDDPGTLLYDESASGVLALVKDPALDLDFDGQPDSDNDGDGRVDEDPGADINNDDAPGIAGVDDDNDGATDEGNVEDDDEDAGLLGALLGGLNEDPADDADADGDGSVDEDPDWDWNGDGQPGVAGVDDDGDGTIDEGASSDDDEDGVSGEDWLDTVVFRVNAGRLLERMPVPWDEDGDTLITGKDVVESVLVEDVAAFEVERLPKAPGAVQRVRLRLELTVPDDDPVALEAEYRVGAGT